jgi:hypothetical protein
MRQARAVARLHQTPNQSATILLCDWCAWVVYFIPSTAPNLFEIQVLANEKDESLLKKSKKNYDVSHKCRNICATQFPWAEMLKSDFGEINYVKCIMCSVVKG